MSTAWLIDAPWLAMALGVAAFAADYGTTLYETYLYHKVMKGFVEYTDRYRLTPEVQAAITQRRWLSPRFMTIIVVLVAGIGAAWWMCVRQIDRPDVFVLLMGALVLAPTAHTLQQYQRIMIFREVRRRGGVKGRATFTRQLSLMEHVYGLYACVILYLLLFVLTGSWFVLGGAVATFINSRRLRDWVVMRAWRVTSDE